MSAAGRLLRLIYSPIECLGDVNERLEAIRNQRLETMKNIQVITSINSVFRSA